MIIEEIAEICHEANRFLCLANGDVSQNPWEEAQDWQRESAIKGVQFAIDNPDAPASAQHDAWSSDKIANGWTYGEVKDPEAKTHPCLVAFEDLSPFQQAKDVMFKSIVASLRPLLVD